MATVILLVHLMIALALVGSVLLQRSEGGALGIGGGGGGGGLMSGRGAANIMTRITAVLAAGFFATSIGLSLLAGWDRDNTVLDQLPSADTISIPAPPAPELPLGSSSATDAPADAAAAPSVEDAPADDEPVVPWSE